MKHTKIKSKEWQLRIRNENKYRFPFEVGLSAYSATNSQNNPVMLKL